MNVAIVITVKNESRLIRQNVYYHLGIGIKKIYVYFDGTEDDSRSKVQDIDGVECHDSISSDIFDDLPFLQKFTAHKLEQHSARQSLNSYDAEQRCKKDGMDWLISIDADEFFLPSRHSCVPLSQFFELHDKGGYEIIRLSVFEVVSRKMHYDYVALEETLFKTKKNFKSKFDQIYFNIVNPYTKTSVSTHYWYSHLMGKCAIKVGRDLIPHNVHKYKSLHEEVAVKTIWAGHILHYFQYDAKDFIKKYQNFKLRPKHYLSGKRIGRLKELYIRLVNDPNNTQADVLHFYKENLLFDKNKLARLQKTRVFNLLPRREEATIEITVPKAVLEPHKELL